MWSLDNRMAEFRRVDFIKYTLVQLIWYPLPAKCGSGGMGSSQRGCFNTCCRGSLEDDQFEKNARENRLKQQNSAAAVDSQPTASTEMTTATPIYKEETKVEVPAS